VPVHTTFVTGILTHLAEESVNGCTHGATCGGRGPPGDPTTSLPSRSDALACTVGSGPATSAGECWVRSSRSTGTCGRSPCRSRSSGAYRRRSRPKGRTQRDDSRRHGGSGSSGGARSQLPGPPMTVQPP
jgi:hypothetical protein